MILLHFMQCMQDGLSVVSEARVAGEDLQGRHKRRKNKEERMKSVLEAIHNTRACPAQPLLRGGSNSTCAMCDLGMVLASHLLYCDSHWHAWQKLKYAMPFKSAMLSGSLKFQASSSCAYSSHLSC